MFFFWGCFTPLALIFLYCCSGPFALLFSALVQLLYFFFVLFVVQLLLVVIRFLLHCSLGLLVLLFICFMFLLYCCLFFLHSSCVVVHSLFFLGYLALSSLGTFFTYCSYVLLSSFCFCLLVQYFFHLFCAGLGTRNLNSLLSCFLGYDFQTMFLIQCVFVCMLFVYFSINILVKHFFNFQVQCFVC